MRAFEVAGTSAEAFVERVGEAIAVRGFTDYVAVVLEEDVLEVRFTYVGRSVLRYRVEEYGEGLRATLVEERMSPFHAPFRAPFDERFEKIIADVGGRVG